MAEVNRVCPVCDKYYTMEPLELEGDLYLECDRGHCWKEEGIRFAHIPIDTSSWEQVAGVRHYSTAATAGISGASNPQPTMTWGDVRRSDDSFWRDLRFTQPAPVQVRPTRIPDFAPVRPAHAPVPSAYADFIARWSQEVDTQQQAAPTFASQQLLHWLDDDDNPAASPPVSPGVSARVAIDLETENPPER